MADPNEVLVRNVALAVERLRSEAGSINGVSRVPTCCEALLDVWGSPFKAPVLPAEARLQFHRIIAGRVFLAWRGEMDRSVGRCESPIEELLLLAMTAVGIQNREVSFERSDCEPFSSWDGCLGISTQVEIGRYRVDFRIDMWLHTILNDPDHEEWRHAEMLVECDGHDFHERTKEQASRDREKDRVLQAAGFQIYRYTGSDLWRDALVAAGEITESLWERAYKSEPLAVRERKSRG